MFTRSSGASHRSSPGRVPKVSWNANMFCTHPGDGLWLPPEERVNIW